MEELFCVTVRTSSELSTALAEFLIEQGARGVEENLTGDELTVYLSSSEEAAHLVSQLGQFEDQAKLALGEPFPFEFEVSRFESDWKSTWRAELAPTAIAQKFVLRPLHAGPAPEGESTLWFEANESFGSGTHPTTQGMAQRIFELKQADSEHVYRRFLDLGSGTGVLSLIALRCGFDHALLLDISEDAVACSQRSLELNHLADRAQVLLGSLDRVTEPFDVIAANVDAATLVRLAPDLAARLSQMGLLLISGFLEEDKEAIGTALGAQGLGLLGEEPAREFVQQTWGARPSH